MHLAYVLLSITVVFLILYLVLGRYIKAWLNKRRRLSKLHQVDPFRTAIYCRVSVTLRNEKKISFRFPLGQKYLRYLNLMIRNVEINEKQE